MRSIPWLYTRRFGLALQKDKAWRARQRNLRGPKGAFGGPEASEPSLGAYKVFQSFYCAMDVVADPTPEDTPRSDAVQEGPEVPNEDTTKDVASLTAEDAIKGDALKEDATAAKDEVTKDAPEDTSSYMGRQGGWRTAPYIFANSACDFFSSYGIMMNMMVYLTTKLKFGVPDAANTITNFMGMCSYTPLLGAFLADAYIGRYRTILISSFVFFVGLIWMVFTAVFRNLHEGSSKVGYLYLAFTIIAIGAGGIRPNAPSFGADQFDQRKPKERKQLQSYFNWYYFCIVVALLFSITMVVYLQNTFGFGWGFGVPAMAMAISTGVFWAGSPIYRQMTPKGSPFTRIAQVISAAFSKRSLALPDDPSVLYHEKRSAEDGIALRHTMQFRFLDNAAIITDDDANLEAKPDPWKLCDVNQVEELKSLMRMAPIWLTGIPVFIAWAQQNTLWMAQGQAMDPHIGSTKFKMPVGSMPIFSLLTMFFLLPLYDKVITPLARKITGNDRGISILKRVGIGCVFTSFSMVIAAIVEAKRKSYSKLHHGHSMSIFMLAPQYSALGLAEGFVVIGYLEFFYDQSPPSMRSMAAATVWAIIGTGSYLSTALVTIVRKTTQRHDGSGGWLGDNVNAVNMEYFFAFLAALVALDFGLHLIVAKYYKYTKPDYDGDHVPMAML